MGLCVNPRGTEFEMVLQGGGLVCGQDRAHCLHERRYEFTVPIFVCHASPPLLKDLCSKNVGSLLLQRSRLSSCL